VASEVTVREARANVAQSEHELVELTQKLSLRKRYLQDHLEPELVAQQMELVQLRGLQERVERLLALAKERLLTAQKRRSAGAVDDLELKSAELDVMVREVELVQLRMRMRLLESRKR
jgi:hypothetical protein